MARRWDARCPSYFLTCPKLVDHHVAPDGTGGYSLEVFNAVGDTIAVTTVLATALEALREDEILCARPLAQ